MRRNFKVIHRERRRYCNNYTEKQFKLPVVVELEVYGKLRKISCVVRKVPGGKYGKCLPKCQRKTAKLIEYKEKRPNICIGRDVKVAKEKRDDVPLLRRTYASKLVVKKDFMLMFKVNECK